MEYMRRSDDVAADAAAVSSARTRWKVSHCQPPQRWQQAPTELETFAHKQPGAPCACAIDWNNVYECTVRHSVQHTSTTSCDVCGAKQQISLLFMGDAVALSIVRCAFARLSKAPRMAITLLFHSAGTRPAGHCVRKVTVIRSVSGVRACAQCACRSPERPCFRFVLLVDVIGLNQSSPSKRPKMIFDMIREQLQLHVIENIVDLMSKINSRRHFRIVAKYTFCYRTPPVVMRWDFAETLSVLFVLK